MNNSMNTGQQRSLKAGPSQFVPAVFSSSHKESAYTNGPVVSLLVWSHDARTSSEDVLLDISAIPHAREGDLAELRTESQHPKKLYFLIKKLTKDESRFMTNIQVSVFSGLLSRLNIPPRSKVTIRLRPKHKVEADLIEVHFKDSYLTRADLWRVASSLTGDCVYSTQKVSYCDVLRLTIHDIYKDGKKRFSCYVGPNTKIVYRSESARTIYFIQMSSEMWNFEENGEVMFHKLVNSFLPEVFKRWSNLEGHHIVTIVLFTSVDISGRKSNLGHGEREKQTQDYYRVVVDQIQISRWNDIMARLRYEFEKFQREVLVDPETGLIRGNILPAVKGNLMEAISLATSLVSSKFNDRDLKHTNIQVTIVTPGTGTYDVDYDLFLQTSMKLLSIEIGIDLVCLSRPPLHVTPLFRFNDENGKTVNCLPSWLDISFWSGFNRNAGQWIPRCKIYDIQMMGVMETELNAISIEYLDTEKSLDTLMFEYDANVFKSAESITNRRLVQNFVQTEPSSDLFNPMKATVIHTHPTLPFYKSTTVLDQAPAIISSPSGLASTSTVLASTMQANMGTDGTTKPRISALTSLLSFGKIGGTLKSSSPVIRNSTSQDVNKPLLGKGSVASLNAISNNKERDADIYHLSSHGQVVGREIIQAARPISTANIRQRTGSQVSVSTVTDGSVPRHREFRLSPSENTFNLTLHHQQQQQELERRAKEQNEEMNYVWSVVDNPSNVTLDGIFNISNNGRWQNVFPKGVKRRSVKWRSLLSPASLPLATELFPSVATFTDRYRARNYQLTVDPSLEQTITPGDLLEEMVALRLHIGFQIVVGQKVSEVEDIFVDGDNSMIVQAIPKEYRGIRLYLTRNDEIHRLLCDQNDNIHVQLYEKIKSDDISSRSDILGAYRPFVKTRYEKHYHPASGNFFNPAVRMVNWNSLDQELAGFGDPDHRHAMKMFRIRFVLLPTGIKPTRLEEVTQNSDVLNPEELAIEGIKKIVSILHKGSYLTKEEQQNLRRHSESGVVSTSPDVNFYTGELLSYLLQFQDIYHEDQLDKGFSDDGFRRDNILPERLAEELQGPKGIKFVDRRWHWKMHRNCFVGEDLVNWLINNFVDINEETEALEYGNELMRKGVFKHAENRHTFLNGHYFYQLKSEYVIKLIPATPDSKASNSWFSKKPRVESPIVGELLPDSPAQQQLREITARQNAAAAAAAAGNDAINNSGISSSGHPSPTILSSPVQAVTSDAASAISSVASMNADLGSVTEGNSVEGGSQHGSVNKKMRRIFVTREQKFSVDPFSRMKRPEFLTVHYGKFHNPANAFPLRLEWLNATPRLIDEAMNNIGRVAERYGLRLAQVPIEEIRGLHNDNPFISSLRAKFSLNPSKDENEEDDPLNWDPQYYQKYILAKNGYVVDTLSASSLQSTEADIEYSWGPPTYNFTQYIHKTGLVLAQIVENDEIIFLTNTLQASRMVATEAASKSNTSTNAGNKTAGFTTPSASATKQSALNANVGYPSGSTIDAENLQLSLKEICENPEQLQELFLEAREAWRTRNKALTLMESFASNSNSK